VTVDNKAAARIATTQLLKLGHRRIAALGVGVPLWTTQQRFQGYRSALRAARTPVDPALLSLECRDAAEVEAALAAMLGEPDPPTAIIAMKNDAGRAAIRALRDARVVLDLTVFDEVADPDLLVIAPSTVVQSDPARLGAAAATMALERLDGLLGPPRRVVMEPLFEHPRSTSLVPLQPIGGRQPAKARKRRPA
jgi:LacI family transcriptional regulator